MNILLTFAVMFVLMFFGMDIFVSMGAASVIYLLFSGNAPLTLVAQNMVNGLSNFSLLAIPLFMMVGELMKISGMTPRLMKFAKYFIGHIKGSMAYTAVFATMILSGVSGSAPACCTATSSVMLPILKEEGYPEDFSAALTATSAIMDPLIPPSIALVFLSLISTLSVGKLFVGGLLPGLLMGVSIMGVCFLKTRKMTLVEPERHKITAKGAWNAFKEAYLSLFAPVIILLGVMSGLVTITEVAILACIYVLFIGMFVYKTIKIKDLFSTFQRSAYFSCNIMAMFSIVGIFSWFVAVEELGKQLLVFIMDINLSIPMFWLFINILFLFLGMIMDAIPAMLIFVPILLPIASSLGVDLIHFGVVVVLNLMIGLITPPVGGLLFLQSKLSGIPFDKLTKACMPFIACLLLVLVLSTVFPQIVLFLPNLFLGGSV